MAVPLQYYPEPVSRPQIMLKSPVYYGGVTQLSHIRSDYDTGFNALVYISLPNNKIHFIYCQPNFHCCNDWPSVIDGFHWFRKANMTARTLEVVSRPYIKGPSGLIWVDKLPKPTSGVLLNVIRMYHIMWAW